MNKRLLTLDLRHDSAEPKHERLKNHFVSEILAGRLKPGHAIPTELHLVNTLGVSRATVRQAMASLKNEGLIRRRQGRGTFVESNVRQKLKPGLDIFALVVPDTRGGVYPSLLRGFEDAAGEFHHQTLICNSNNDVSEQGDIILQLVDKKIGGVAMMPTDQLPTPAYQIRQLQEHGIPVVFCHRRVEGIMAPLAAIPYSDVGRLAGKALVEHGHRRVALFTTKPVPVVRAYEEGLREALRAGGCDVSVQSMYVTESMVALEEEPIQAALQQVFARPDPPTAIFTTFDSMAEMIYLLLPRLGLRVPEDVSLRQILSATVNCWAIGVRPAGTRMRRRTGRP